MTRLRKYLCLGIATLALSTASSTLAQEMTTVDAPAGSLQGVEVDGIHTFKGIPYALPPVGGRRWQPPLPVPHWTGQRDARAFGPACIQPDAKAVSVYTEDPMPQSEDCLSLNVWAPHHAQKAPVLFWIHGGALVNGSSRESMYDGATLAKRGVIVVSINYRLGVLGWMAHPELSAESPDHISGNYGLMDQIAALHWVRDNITAFGGDPANVTIAGESAGALSVLYLLESPAAHGLFAKAVSESGYMISMPELKRAAFGAPSGEAAGQMLGMALQAPDLASLRGMDAKTLTNAAARMFAPWGLVDGKLLPQQMTTAFDKGEIAHVPLLAGFNQGEIRTLRALAPKPPTTAAEYEAGIRARYGDLSDAFLKLYPATNYAESILATTRRPLRLDRRTRRPPEHRARPVGLSVPVRPRLPRRRQRRPPRVPRQRNTVRLRHGHHDPAPLATNPRHLRTARAFRSNDRVLGQLRARRCAPRCRRTRMAGLWHRTQLHAFRPKPAARNGADARHVRTERSSAMPQSRGQNRVELERRPVLAQTCTECGVPLTASKEGA